MTRPDHLGREEYLEMQRRAAVDLARSMLDGRTGVIDGAREMWRLGETLGRGTNEVFRVFQAIDSETDHLPVGPVRGLWDGAALKVKDREIAAAEARWRAEAMNACGMVLEMLRNGMDDADDLPPTQDADDR